jgi:monoamine oxidase
VGEGRLWERLRIYSGKLFIAIKLILFCFNKAYYQESYILIIAYASVVNVAEWLDGSFESQNRL